MVDNAASAAPTPKGWRFWVTLFAICLTFCITSFELTVVAVALPYIAQAIHTEFEFTWVVSTYLLSAAAAIPITYGLAHAIGRRPTFLISVLLFFIVGSGLACLWNGLDSLSLLIAVKVPQGIGAGGLQTVGAIILSDHIAIQERGRYSALINLMIVIPFLLGPIFAGALIDNVNLNVWIFMINLPVAGLALFLLGVFVKSPVPRSGSSAFKQVDWIGNFLIVGATASIATALVWGGSVYSWSSYKILLPLIFGIAALAAFVYWEVLVATNPILPISSFTNRTTISGYIQTFCASLVTYAVIYYVPVYYLACTDATLYNTGIYMLGFGAIVPAAIVAWVFIYVKRYYRPAIWFGWSFIVVGVALLSIAKAGESQAHVVGVSGLIGAGLGFLSVSIVHTIQAPLNAEQSAHAVNFMVYLRTISGVWGIAIGASVFQNELARRVPPSFLHNWWGFSVSGERNAAWMYGVAANVRRMDEPTHSQLQEAFKDSLQVVWIVITSIATVGLVSSFLMRPVPVQEHMHGGWQVMQSNEKIEKEDVKRHMGQAA